MLSTRHKVIIMGLNLLTAAGVIAVGRAVSDELTTEAAALVASDHNWLLFISGLFVAGFYIAWRFKSSFSVSTSRMLIWAIVAYLGISNAIDLMGTHYGIIEQILGLSRGNAESALLIELRARLAVFAVVIAMAITSIAIGFESSEEG